MASNHITLMFHALQHLLPKTVFQISLFILYLYQHGTRNDSLNTISQKKKKKKKKKRIIDLNVEILNRMLSEKKTT